MENLVAKINYWELLGERHSPMKEEIPLLQSLANIAFISIWVRVQ